MTALASGLAAAAENEILVAVAGPMTGQYALYGAEMRAGAESAVGYLNRSSGLSGPWLHLIVEDDGCDKELAVAVAQRLVKQRVALVVGHHCASASIAAAPIYAAAGIIMISPGTTDPLLTDKRAGPTIFRLAPRSDGEGRAIGAYIARVFAGKRVAVLHDRTAVGKQLAADTKKAMNAGGLTEALFSGFIAGERDYAQLARDMRTYRVDAVFLGAYPTEAALILRALRNEQLATVVVGSTLLDAKDFYTAAHPMLNALVIQPTGFALDSLDAKAATEQLDPHERTVGSREIVGLAKSAVQIWAQAANRAAVSRPSATPPAQIMQSGTFQTMFGEFGFDKKGDATLRFYKMFSWKDADNTVPAP